METAKVIDLSGVQVVELPASIHVETSEMTVRREGEALILTPLKPQSWPADFFEAIRIDDPAFVRPEQGPLPPAPAIQ